jgi:hypothetical protein
LYLDGLIGIQIFETFANDNDNSALASNAPLCSKL